MNKKCLKSLILMAMVGLGVGSCCAVGAVFAEEEEKNNTVEAPATSISLTPVYNVIQIASDSAYTNTFEVKNDGESKMSIEVYAAPYSYAYSEDEDAYKLGFNKENNFTQITRWITFKDSGGSWVKKPQFEIGPKETLEIAYKVSTPSNIPPGGQYAVIFAHTLTATTSASGIKTEASPGLIIYGHSSEGDVTVQAEISDMKVEEGVTKNGETKSGFSGFAKVKNTGNIDFYAKGTLKIENLFGGVIYETPSGTGQVSIIPETELVVSNGWDEAPGFGIYKATWTVEAGEETQTIDKIIFVNPILFILIVIIVLTIVIVCVIVITRRRKERRSRLAV